LARIHFVKRAGLDGRGVMPPAISPVGGGCEKVPDRRGCRRRSHRGDCPPAWHRSASSPIGCERPGH